MKSFHHFRKSHAVTFLLARTARILPKERLGKMALPELTRLMN